MTGALDAVVGAGLAGLSCAGLLHRRGAPVRVFDASDGPEGRVRTDHVDGFTQGTLSSGRRCADALSDHLGIACDGSTGAPEL